MARYVAVAETLWRTAPSDIARAANVAGGEVDTRIVTDMLALKMDAREMAGPEGERAAIAKLAVRLGRLSETDLESLMRALSVSR